MKNSREQILEKTFLLLLENGLDGLSISKLQECSGLSRGLLYRYFDSKSDLILNVCKRYFFERYFTFCGDLNKISLCDFIALSQKSAKNLFESLEKLLGKKVDILRYNMLYAEVLQNEPLFLKYARNEIGKMRIVVKNAIKNGEIKKGISPEFLENVFLDILGRVACISKNNKVSFSDTFKDCITFYNLIKAS